MRGRAGLLALALALTACGGEDDDGGSGGAAAAPADDRTVVALDEFAAVALLSLGVEPDLALTVFDYESTGALLADQGVATQPYGAALDVERVLAADPDVVVGVSIPTTLEVQDRLQQVAPTTVLDYASSWQDQLTAAAGAVGAQDRAAGVVAGLEARTRQLRDDLAAAGRGGVVVSVLGDNPDLFSPPPDSPVGSLLAAAGLARPPAQQQASGGGSPFTLLSEELLPEQDGDEVLLLSGGPYATADLTGSRLWPGLPAVQRGDVAEVSGEVWLSSSAFAVDWVLDDLRAVLLEEGAVAAAGDAAGRFRAFLDEQAG